MFRINYYGHSKNARTSAGAIRAAKSLTKQYGQGCQNPVIDCDTDEEARDLEKLQELMTHTSYGIRVDGERVY